MLIGASIGLSHAEVQLLLCTHVYQFFDCVSGYFGYSTPNLHVTVARGQVSEGVVGLHQQIYILEDISCCRVEDQGVAAC